MPIRYTVCFLHTNHSSVNCNAILDPDYHEQILDQCLTSKGIHMHYNFRTYHCVYVDVIHYELVPLYD